jgi:hypothetical protein
MIEWTTVEDAIAAWVRLATGLPVGKVFWSRQGGDWPSSAFVVISVERVRRVGTDWQEVVPVPSPAPRQELEQRSRGVRELLLGLQCVAPPRTGATGAQSAVALLEGVVAAAALPGRRAALGAAGVGVVGFGPILGSKSLVGRSADGGQAPPVAERGPDRGQALASVVRSEPSSDSRPIASLGEPS